MNTEPRNKESYPRSLAHFQLQYRKKQAVVTEFWKHKDTAGFPTCPVLHISVFNYTTASNYYCILLFHTVPTRDKENTDSFSSSPSLQPTAKFVAVHKLGG